MTSLILALALVAAEPEIAGTIHGNESTGTWACFKVSGRQVYRTRLEIRWGDRSGLPFTTLRDGMRVRISDPQMREASVTIEDDPVGDFRFSLTQEAWVRDTIPDHRREGALRPHTRHLLGLLGSPCWHCRELASDDVFAMGPRLATVLAWGRHSRDAEVRDRVEQLIVGIERSMCGPAEPVTSPDEASPLSGDE